jgi:hypothetical protein
MKDNELLNPGQIGLFCPDGVVLTSEYISYLVGQLDFCRHESLLDVP